LEVIINALNSRIDGAILTFALTVAVAFFAIIILLWRVIFPLHGFIFYGDCCALVSFDLGFFIKSTFFTWTKSVGASTGYLFLFPYLVYGLIGQIVGYQLEERVQILLLAVLPTVSMYLAVRLLNSVWFKNTTQDWAGQYFVPALAGILYGLNYVNSNITDPLGAAGLQYAYILLPVTFALFVKYLHDGKSKYLLCLAVLSMFAATSPVWFVFFSFLVLSYLVFLFILDSNIGRWRLFRRTFTAIPALSLINAFWILPTTAGYLLKASGPFSVYQPAQRLSFSGMQNMYTLLDALVFGHRTYDLFGTWLQNWSLVNLIIPIAAFSAILLYRNKFVMYLTIIALISTFLLKATNPPFGFLYYDLARSLPYGVGAVLANYGTWAYVQAFSFFFLAILTLAAILNRNNGALKASSTCPSSSARNCSMTVKKKSRISRPRVVTILVSVMCVAILSAAISGLCVDSQVYLPRYQPVDLPSPYYQINNWLSQQPGDGNMMWIPQGGTYIWKPYIITNFPNTISSRPAVSESMVNSSTLTQSSTLGSVFSWLGVKYIVYHGDSLQPSADVLSNLMSQSDLRIVYSLNYTFSGVVPLIQFSPTTAGLNLLELVNTSLLTDGTGVLATFKFSIPQVVLDEGFNCSNFGGSLGLRMAVYPHGTTERTIETWGNNRISEVFPKNFTIIDNASGYVTFKVLVSAGAFSGDSVDVYLNYFGSRFRSVSPVYFVGTFSVTYGPITVPFIVFENEEYAGQIFPSSVVLMYGDMARSAMETIGDANRLMMVSLSNNSVSDDLLRESSLLAYSSQSLPSWLTNCPDKMLWLSSLEDTKILSDGQEPLTPVGNLSLESGESTLVTFGFCLPQAVIDEGFNTSSLGKSLGMRLEIYPHGTTEPTIETMGKGRVSETFLENLTIIDTTTGYVTFEVTIPTSSLMGNSADAYVNYYTSRFSPVGPIYFVCTFPVINNQQPPSFQAINCTMLVTPYVAKNGTYTIAIRNIGPVSVNGTGVNGNGNWVNVNTLDLTTGTHTLNVSTSSEAVIQDIALFNADNRTLSDFVAPPAKLSYSEISPVQWKVTLNASGPVQLVFTQPFDSLWKANTNGEGPHSISYNLVNIFTVNETGNEEILLSYTLQPYFEIGLAISLITLGALIAYVSILATKRPKSFFNRHQINKANDTNISQFLTKQSCTHVQTPPIPNLPCNVFATRIYTLNSLN
jgi:hypothetical protein